MSIGENIRAIRKRQGISAEVLAKKLGISPSTVYRYESGDIEKVDSMMIPRIARILNTTPSEVMGWANDSANRTTPTNTGNEHENEIQPNLEAAAQKAAEVLIRHKVSTAPVMPIAILKSIPGVFVVSFTELADNSGVDNNNLVTLYDSESQDVVTITKEIDGKRRYIIAYNQRLPFYIIHRAMARELGHIMLGHDRTQLDDTQIIEALCFARHLLCPRPLIKALQDNGVNLTVEIIGNITGLYGRSIAGMRETPGAHIEAKTNRRIKEQFTGYINNFLNYQSIMTGKADTTPADFGTYMDNYEE